MNFIHRILYGHGFVPLVIGYDKHGFDEHLGCELCYLGNPEGYQKQLHKQGICMKQRLSYTCHQRPGECGDLAELARKYSV